MSIKLPLLFEGSKGETTLMTWFDNSATYSYINHENEEKLAIVEKMWRPLEILKDNSYLKIDHRIRLDFYVNDIRLSDEFMVIPNLSEDVILGANTLQKWRIKLDFEHDTVIVDPKVAKAILK